MVFGWALTVVDAVAELFAAFGSLSVAATLAVLEMVPGWTGTTFTVTVAVAPLLTVPRLQVTVAVPEQEPWLGTAEVNMTVAGSGSVTMTFVAFDGPALPTVSV